MREFELIAEVDDSLKWAKLYYSGGHLASCHPEKPSIEQNVYKALKGGKIGMDTHFVSIPVSGVALTDDNLRKLQQEAIDIVRAKKSFKKQKI